MNLFKGMVQNILLMIAGFLSCLTGNFFLGLLIGLGAGALQCTFSGATGGKSIKAAALSSLPVAIVVGVLCGVGGMFSGGLHDVGGWIIALVVTVMCGIVGTFIKGTRYFQEQTNEPVVTNENRVTEQAKIQAQAESNGAPISETSRRMLANLRGTATEVASIQEPVQAAQEPIQEPVHDSDYDEIIDTSKGDRDYYNLIKDLTGKQVVTKRIEDEAYEKLPEEIRAKYANDPPVVALTSYAKEKALAEEDAYVQKVKELSGFDRVTPDAVHKAYESLTEEQKADLPKDEAQAMMMFASGKTLSSETKEEEKERAAHEKEIEDYYSVIPDDFKERLPSDHAKAVEMFKNKEFLPFYETLDDSFKKRVPEEVFYSVVPKAFCENRQSVENYLWTTKEKVLSMFCKEFPEPLCNLPATALVALLPQEETEGKDPVLACKNNIDFLSSLFDNSLTSPLNHVPVKTLWLLLPLKDRQHPNAMIIDIKAHQNELYKKYQYVHDYNCPVENLFIPYYCCEPDKLEEMYEKARPYRKQDESKLFALLMNIDRCIGSNNNTIHFWTTPLLRIIPYDMFKYMMEWSLGYDEEDTDPEQYYAAHKNNREVMMANESLPKPLNDIPMFMLWFFIEDMELLNSDNKVASMCERVLQDPNFFMQYFKWNGDELSSYIPTICLDAWTEDDFRRATRRECNEDYIEEPWRVWLPECLAYIPTSDLEEACMDIPPDRNPTVLDILTQAKHLRSVFAQE